MQFLPAFVLLAEVSTVCEKLQQRERKRQKYQRQQHRRRQQRREAHRNNQAERDAHRKKCKEIPQTQPLHRKLQQSAYMNKKKFERMLVKLGFRLLHIDEYLISTMLPYCETGRVADGQSDLMHPRCLNRDLAAAMNFQHIANGLQRNGAVPECFQRGNRVRDNAVVPDNGEVPPDSPPAQRRRTD
ncbi:hypothetical protein IWW48_003212 [Coemansia sp. RSA 1200]|nr:hypothetical protein IWW48_003212 [Coemansia sp. RSA 1200]